MVLEHRVRMSTLLLNLSKKVLIFLCKIRQGPRRGGKGGKLCKSIWAFQKKIAQGLPDLKMPSPRPFAGIFRVGEH